MERLYHRFHHPEFIGDDPVGFLRCYPALCDREVVGLIAASLAYGRVAQIHRSVRRVLDILGPEPSQFLKMIRPARIKRDFSAFRHRVTSGQDFSALLIAIRSVLLQSGSLGAIFISEPQEATIIPALARFVGTLTHAAGRPLHHLVPNPENGSACKRLNLYLRWMIRKDGIDPGGWNVPPSKLIMPIDTHIHRFALNHGFTQRKNAGLHTAIEVTDCFRQIEPNDPLRYDFILARTAADWRLLASS